VKILIVKPSSLGDVLHALPAVSLLRRRFPDASISWLVNDTFAGIVELFPGIDEIIVFRRQRWGQVRHCLELARFLLELRRRRFDLVIDLQGLFRSGFFTWTTGASRRIGFKSAREGARWFYNDPVLLPANLRHAVDKNLFLVRSALEIPESGELPELRSRPEFVRKAAENLAELGAAGRPVLAVAPAARWESKTWSPEFFAETISAVLRQRPDTVVWLLGTLSERQIGDQIQRCCPTLDLHNQMGATDLGTLVEMLRRSNVMLTNDSGPMHIGAALKTPTVALFGPTSSELTGPYGEGHRVFCGVCEYRPCLQRVCPLKIQTCQQIDPAEVAGAILSVIARTHPVKGEQP
jgi:lipopolysaccharide heptosyltransferase I